MSTEERIDRARLLHESSIFAGDVSALAAADRELDAVEAGLALARDRIAHGRFLAQRSHGAASRGPGNASLPAGSHAY